MREARIPKGNGKFRSIVMPDRQEKAMLNGHMEFFNWLQYVVTPPNVCHGFMSYRNPFTCALPHVDYRYTVCIDLADFFDTVTKKMLTQFIDSKYIDQFFYKGYAAQGLPTSPPIANIAASNMDWWLFKKFKKMGCVYTRYADDMTVSFNDLSLKDKVLKMLVEAVNKYNFAINPNKTEFQDDADRRRRIVGMTVDTGLFGNEETPRERGVFVSRKKYRNRLRSALKHVEDGSVPIVDGKKVEAWFQASGLSGWVHSKKPMYFDELLSLQEDMTSDERIYAKKLCNGNVTGNYGKPTHRKTTLLDMAIIIKIIKPDRATDRIRYKKRGIMPKLISGRNLNNEGYSEYSVRTINYYHHNELFSNTGELVEVIKKVVPGGNIDFLKSKEIGRLSLAMTGRALEVLPLAKSDEEKETIMRIIGG